MNQNVQDAMQVLKDAQAQLNTLLAPLPNLQARSKTVLDTLINGLGHTIGASETATDKGFAPQTLTEAWGIETREPSPTTVVVEQPDVEALRERAQAAYNTFAERENTDLMVALTELDIRAVAKIAGLDVTPTNPKQIDALYIDKIKEAIKQQKLLAEQQEAERIAEQQRLAKTNPKKEPKAKQ